MIVDVKKYLIYGAKGQMDRFFELAQRAGFIEFIGIWHKKTLEIPNDVRAILLALRIIRNYNPSESETEFEVFSSCAMLAEKIVELQRKREKFLLEQRTLSVEIARVAPFGDFYKTDLQMVQQEGRRVIQFFCMKGNISRDITLPPEVLWISSENDLDYYVAINDEKKQYPKMIEVLIETPLGELRSRHQELSEEIAIIESTLKRLAIYGPLLQEGLVEALNHHQLDAAKHDASFPMGESLFAIEAWVPKSKINGLFGILSNLSVFCEEIAIEPNDRIPTYLENQPVAKIGEDLMHIYDTPSVKDRDPSAWILVFFSIFFAMIVADAGYGILYLLLGFFLKFRFPRLSGSGKRFVRLTFILATTTIIWGVCTSIFFGVELSPDNPLHKVGLIHHLVVKKAEYILTTKNDVYAHFLERFPQIESAKNGHEFLNLAKVNEKNSVTYVAEETFSDNILMELSLVVGMIHISLSFARYLGRHWNGIGWIAFMWGGYLFFPATVLNCLTIVNFMGWISPPIALILGKYLLFGGFGLAIATTCFQHGIADGFAEAMHVTRIFGDVLSYLRLYALGLAGMLMATTINSMGMDFSLFVGIFILILGHLANIGISLMAGTIHGLRLNFLEWYHFSFEGGGRLFKPLQMKRPNS